MPAQRSLGYRICANCNGNGHVRVGSSVFEGTVIACPACGGSGQFYLEPPPAAPPEPPPAS